VSRRLLVSERGTDRAQVNYCPLTDAVVVGRHVLACVIETLRPQRLGAKELAPQDEVGVVIAVEVTAGAAPLPCQRLHGRPQSLVLRSDPVQRLGTQPQRLG